MTLLTEGKEVPQKAKADLFQAYKEDPVFFVEHALGHLTWGKQREILESVRDNEKTAVRACHGSSKTFTSAEIVTWFLYCYTQSKVITTAPIYPQVKKLLWAEINKIYLRCRSRLPGICLTTEIKDPDHPDHYAFGFSTDRPSKAEGWHSPEILFIFDEAKGIHPWAWDSARGSMTGGHCRWLVISTTDGVDVGEPFYQCFMKKGSTWDTIHITAFDSPYLTGEKFQGIEWIDGNPYNFRRFYVDPQDIVIQIASQRYIDEGLEEWGEDSPLYKTKVLGELMEQGEWNIVSLPQIRKMFNNALKDDFPAEGKEQIGVDVARGGEDDTVFVKRKGLKVLDYLIIPSPQLPPKAKLVFIADKLCLFMDGRTSDLPALIDDTGVGGGLTDIMQDREYQITPINFQETAISPDKFPNTISEMWFTVTVLINEIACEEFGRLETELANRKFKIDKKGRRMVESKDEYKSRGFRSPDFADAFLLAFYERAEDEVALYQSKHDYY